MNLKQIREEAWDIAREVATVDLDRLWTTREMNRYINRTYRFIARETKCIRDSTTASVCMIPVNVVDYTTYVAGTIDYIWANTTVISDITDPAYDPTAGKYWLFHQNVTPYKYALNPLILDIDEVKWTNRSWKLTKVSVSKWQINPWWEQVVGMPTEYATDLDNNTLAINFRDTTADILRLHVRRLPLTDLVFDTDTPEFRTHYHDYFVNGVLWQMYAKQDVETFDLAKAAMYKADFYADIDEIKQQERILNQKLNPNHSLDAFR